MAEKTKKSQKTGDTYNIKKKDNTAITVALIAASATLLTALINLASPWIERLSVSTTPTSTIAPTTTQENYPTILIDSFDTNQGLDVWEKSMSFGGVMEGVFRIGVIKPETATWRTYGTIEVSDFRLKVNIDMPISTKEYSCGIVLRQDDHGTYFFGINNDRRYEFANLTRTSDEDEQKHYLAEWIGHPIIEAHGKNTLEVIAIGDTFDLFINGVKVDTIIDASHTRGGVGFYAYTYGGGQEIIVDFDDLVIEKR